MSLSPVIQDRTCSSHRDQGVSACPGCFHATLAACCCFSQQGCHLPGDMKSCVGVGHCGEGQAGNTRWEIRCGMEPAGPAGQGRAAAERFKGTSWLRCGMTSTSPFRAEGSHGACRAPPVLCRVCFLPSGQAGCLWQGSGKQSGTAWKGQGTADVPRNP